MKSENKIKRQIKQYMKLFKKLEKRGGPEESGDLFEKLLFAEEDILAEFGLTSTSDNQELMQSFCDSVNNDFSADTLIHLLKIKAEGEEGDNRSPLEILYIGIMSREEAENVLPKMGLINHEYNIYLYELALQNTDAVIELYTEMCRAKEYLGEISQLKQNFKKLWVKNIDFLQPFLMSDFVEEKE